MAHINSFVKLLIAAGAFLELLSGSGSITCLLDEKIVLPDYSYWTWLQTFWFLSAPSVSVHLKFVTAISHSTFYEGCHSSLWSCKQPLTVKIDSFTACFYVSAGKMVHLRSLFFLLWTDNLLIDYQFTFSLIQEDDNHYTAINFMASPEQVDISYFSCAASFSFLMKWFEEKIPKPKSFDFFDFFVMSSLLYLSSSVPVIPKANKNLDMSINASNNFNLNITWSVGSTGTSVWLLFLNLFPTNRAVLLVHLFLELYKTKNGPEFTCY